MIVYISFDGIRIDIGNVFVLVTLDLLWNVLKYSFDILPNFR